MKGITTRLSNWAGKSLLGVLICAAPAYADLCTYTGAVQSFQATATGTYSITAFGASGAENHTSGGKALRSVKISC